MPRERERRSFEEVLEDFPRGSALSAARFRRLARLARESQQKQARKLEREMKKVPGTRDQMRKRLGKPRKERGA